MSRKCPFALLLLAATASTAFAQVPNTCTTQATCFASAQSKYTTTLATGVGTRDGARRNLLVDTKTNQAWAIYQGNQTLNWLPETTTVGQTFSFPEDNLPSDFTPSSAAWIIPSDGTHYLARTSDIPTFDYNNGFTLMINSWIDPGEASYFKGFFTFIYTLGKGGPLTYLTIGRNGNQWGIEAKPLSSSSTPSYYLFPWDAVGHTGEFEDAFFTFSPDGKLEIDIFHAQDWESSLLDFGANLTPYPSPGTTTSNPTSYPFIAINNEYLDVGDPANRGTSGWNHVSIFASPLSSKETAAWAYNYDGGTWHNYPCNTGLELNFAPPVGQPPVTSVDNACGYKSNWTRTQATTAAPTVSLSSASLSFSSQASPTPYTSSPQQITVTNSGQSTLSISSIEIGPSTDPNTGNNFGDFSESDNCSGGVAAGASCSIAVTFTDNDQRATGVLQILSNAATSPDTVSLDGSAE